jgi:hypothetical protein
MDAASGTSTLLPVLDNDSDSDGDAMNVVAWTSPQLGVIEPTADRAALTYSAPDQTRGTDTFTYTVSDAYGMTATATVTINVTPTVDPDGPLTLIVTAPNPTRDSATLTVLLPRPTHVHVAIYDVLGRRTALLFDREQAAGRLEIPVDTSNWASGVYFYRLRAEGQVFVGKMHVLR